MIAIICAGEFEKPDKVTIAKIQKAKYLIAVDGGANHLSKLNIKANLYIGDEDSIASKATPKDGTKITLNRLKDTTDLEAAIEKAAEIDPKAHIEVWGALGGRLDHTLYNMYVLLRNPCEVFFETKNQRVFGIDKKCGRIEFETKKYKSMILIALNGSAKGVEVSKSETIDTVKYGWGKIIDLEEIQKPFLKVEKGELIVILDKRTPGQL